MHTDYRHPAFEKFRDIQLKKQGGTALFALAAAAEYLIQQLIPQRSYGCDSLCERLVTGSPSVLAAEISPGFRLLGADACHDLQLLIEDLTDAAELPVESAGEHVHTVAQLSKLFDVSTKTISRWRQQGLVGRKFVIDGRKRVGFLKSSVDRFVMGNRDRIERSSRFRQMTDVERGRIVTDARRLSKRGCGINNVARQLSEEMQRSPGTIRGTIKQYDRLHPDQAIFPDSGTPLNDELRKKIYHLYQNGASIDDLAVKFSRTRTTIYRIVARERYQDIVNLSLDYVANPNFPRIRNTAAILDPMPESENTARKPKIPADLPSYLASLYEVPLLTREQEQYLFRKFNYAKYSANRLRKKLDSNRPQIRLMDEIETLYEQAVATKNLIIRANLRLVVSIAKRYVGPQENFFELVSDGNASLIRAAEKFDFSRGFKFSTYASWAIMKNYARSIPNELRHRERFRTSHDELFAVTEERRTNSMGQELEHRGRISEIRKILTRLDDREQKIIIHRFGLDYSQEPQTLKQVGETMGVTKERVRQIESRALDKLRVAVKEDRIDPPGIG